MKMKGREEKAKGKRERRAFALTICLFAFASLLAACAVDERRAIPPEAQATIDSVTEDIAAGRDEKVYEEAAPEWRASVSADENKKILGQARTRLGRVNSRALHSGTVQERQAETGTGASGHTLVVNYQTTFERGTAMETFTLIEREGRWLLAGYSISSSALK
jgi:hypothetical protein